MNYEEVDQKGPIHGDREREREREERDKADSLKAAARYRE